MSNEPADTRPDTGTPPVADDPATTDDEDVVAHGTHDEDEMPWCIGCSSRS